MDLLDIGLWYLGVVLYGAALFISYEATHEITVFYGLLCTFYNDFLNLIFITFFYFIPLSWWNLATFFQLNGYPQIPKGLCLSRV